MVTMPIDLKFKRGINAGTPVAHFYVKGGGSASAHSLVQAAKASSRPILLMHGPSWVRDCLAREGGGMGLGHHLTYHLTALRGKL